MRLFGVIWGLFKMIILTFISIIAILLYHGFGTINKYLKTWDFSLGVIYKTNILDGGNKTLNTIWYAFIHIILQILISILWLIVAPARWARNFTIKAIEELS